MFSFPFVSYSLPHRALQNVLFNFPHIQFSSVTQSGPTLCYPMNCSPLVLPVHHQLWSSLKLTSIELVMPSSHLISVIPCCSFPQSLPASVISNESTPLRWPKYWSFRFSISPSKEHPGLISFRMD